MMMPDRQHSYGNSYRYGFNGKENDNEVKGIEGTQQDYGLRIYDPRIGKFLSVDPLMGQFPYYSPYQFSGNTPIQAIDLDGGEPKGYKWDNPYVASHPGSGVTRVWSEYDTEPLHEASIGGYFGIINRYVVQDVDKRMYVVYEDAHRTRQWAVEYENGEWKGNVNEFKWSTPPDPSGLLRNVLVGTLVGVPGILEYGGGWLLLKIVKHVAEENETPETDEPDDIYKDIDFNKEEYVSVYHKGELKGGAVGGTRPLSTGKDKSSVEALERSGKVWEFKIPKSKYQEWERDGLVTPLKDIDKTTGRFNEELRFDPSTFKDLNNYIIK